MKPHTLKLLPILGALLFAGCALPSVPPGPLSAPLPVALQTEATTPANVNAWLGEVFAGKPGSPVLEIISTKAERSVADVGMSFAYTYTITAVFHAPSGNQVLRGVGTSKRFGEFRSFRVDDNAAREAVADLARQVAALTR